MADDPPPPPDDEQDALTMLVLPPDESGSSVQNLGLILTADVTGRQIRNIARKCNTAAYGECEGVLQITCRMIPRAQALMPMPQPQMVTGDDLPTPISGLKANANVTQHQRQDPDATPPSAQPHPAARPPPPLQLPQPPAHQESQSSPLDLIPNLNLTQESAVVATSQPTPSKVHQPQASIQVERTQPRIAGEPSKKRARATSEEVEGAESVSDIERSSIVAQPSQKRVKTTGLHSSSAPSNLLQQTKRKNGNRGGWTTEEDDAIREGYRRGLNAGRIAAEFNLNRSASALRNRKRWLGASSSAGHIDRPSSGLTSGQHQTQIPHASQNPPPLEQDPVPVAGPSRGEQSGHRQLQFEPVKVAQKNPVPEAGPSSGPPSGQRQLQFQRDKGKARAGEAPKSTLRLMPAQDRIESTAKDVVIEGSTVPKRIEETQPAVKTKPRVVVSVEESEEEQSSSSDDDTSRVESIQEEVVEKIESVDRNPQVEVATASHVVGQRAEGAAIVQSKTPAHSPDVQLTSAIERRVRVKQRAPPEHWETLPARPGADNMLVVSARVGGPTCEIHNRIFADHRDCAIVRDAVKICEKGGNLANVQEEFDFRKLAKRIHIAKSCADWEELKRLEERQRRMERERRQRHGLPAPPRKTIVQHVETRREGSQISLERQEFSKTDSEAAGMESEESSSAGRTFHTASLQAAAAKGGVPAEDEDEYDISKSDEEEIEAVVRKHESTATSMIEEMTPGKQLQREAEQSEMARIQSAKSEEDLALLNLVPDDAVAVFDGEGKLCSMIEHPAGHESPLVVRSEVGTVDVALKRDANRLDRQRKRNDRRLARRAARQSSVASSSIGSEVSEVGVSTTLRSRHPAGPGHQASTSAAVSTAGTAPAPGSMAPPPRPVPRVSDHGFGPGVPLTATTRAAPVLVHQQVQPPAQRRLPRAAMPEADLPRSRFNLNWKPSPPRSRILAPTPRARMYATSDENPSSASSRVRGAAGLRT